jgi:hypothetical protein
MPRQAAAAASACIGATAAASACRDARHGHGEREQSHCRHAFHACDITIRDCQRGDMTVVGQEHLDDRRAPAGIV